MKPYSWLRSPHSHGDAMTGTDKTTGVVDLFDQGTRRTSEPGAAPIDDSSLEAMTLVEKKLKSQVSLIGLAKQRDLSAAELQQALLELKALTGSILGDLDRLIPALVGNDADVEPASDLFTRLTHLCAGFRATSNILCILAVLPRHLRLDDRASEILFRAIRELLTNVRRHSRASRVEIASEIGADGTLTLSVDDDGIGLPKDHNRLSALESGAVGLSSIELRMREIGGYMEIESGTGVCARLVMPAHSVATHVALPKA